MNYIEFLLRYCIPLLYRSGKPFRMKGGEVERVKGIEPSTFSKLQ